MKSLSLFLMLLLLSQLAFSQTYTYTKRTEKIKYETMSGETRIKEVGSSNGTFTVKHEIGIDAQRTKLFTVYINGVEEQWYGLLENKGNLENNGTIYSFSKYAATTSDEVVTVLRTLDDSKIIIIFPNKMIEYSK